MAIYIEKIEVWNGSQMMWVSFQTSTLMHKTCLFYVFGTLHACAGSYLCAHASRLRGQVDSCVCMPRASLALFFKKRFICSLKVIFFISIFLKSI